MFTLLIIINVSLSVTMRYIKDELATEKIYNKCLSMISHHPVITYGLFNPVISNLIMFLYSEWLVAPRTKKSFCVCQYNYYSAQLYSHLLIHVSDTVLITRIVYTIHCISDVKGVALSHLPLDVYTGLVCN